MRKVVEGCNANLDKWLEKSNFDSLTVVFRFLLDESRPPSQTFRINGLETYRPNIEGPFEPGPYCRRYTQNGKRKWECVGPELALALNEQRNRQTALARGKPPEQPEGRKSLSRAIESYLAEVTTSQHTVICY